jgi:O-antigen/teichoic acid export membrane protein
MISVEDFGIASTFAIMLALVEMTSNIALDRLLVQAPDGDDPRLEATVHALQFVRGALGAAFLFAIAGPLATVFRVPKLMWAYQLLALVPFMRGLVHLDMFRSQRNMRFRQSVMAEFGSIVFSTLAAVPLADWLGDFRVMLYVILIQQALYTLLSHCFAERPYRWMYNRPVVRRAVSFGWPLLLNGSFMFAALHGDRVIIGNMFGMEELGWFSAASALTLAPAFICTKTLNSLFLPQLSIIQDRKEEFDRLFLAVAQAAIFLGALFGLFFTVLGPPLIGRLYGEKYDPAMALIILLSIMQGVRICKSAPSLAAIARGETKNPMIANFVRALFLPVAWLVAWTGTQVPAVICVAIMGEMVSLASSLYLLRRILRLPLRALGLPMVFCFILFSLIGLSGYLSYALSTEGIILKTAVGGLLLVLLVWSMPEFRSWGSRQLLLATRSVSRQA